MESLLAWIHTNAMGISAGILLLAYVFIATEKIPKVTVALLGASLTWFAWANTKTDGWQL